MPPVPPRQRNLPNLATIAPQLIASLAISVAVIVLFVADLFVALGEPTGTPGNIRLLQFLSPADVAVGAILVVAVALVAVFPISEPASSPSPSPASVPALLRPAEVRLIAGFVAIAVATAGLARAIVALTIAHQHVASKLGNMIDALAAVLVAAVAAFWALGAKS